MAALLDVARSHIGIKEIPGDKHNPAILQMFKDVGHPEIKADEVAWCAAFVGSALKSLGYPIPAKDVSLLARSYCTYGVKSNPVPGAIGVWPRGNSSWQGHVAIVEKANGDGTVTVIGGNQSNAVTRARYQISNALAFRMPVRADEKDLRTAGSKEIKVGDRLEKGGIGTVVTGVVKTITDELSDAADKVDITSLPQNLTLWEQIIKGAENVWDLVARHPGLALVVGAGVVAVVVGRIIKKHRVKRAAEGVPLSSQVIAVNHAGEEA